MDKSSPTSFLQKLIFCIKIAQMPILEIIQFKTALVLIIKKIMNRFVAYILLVVSFLCSSNFFDLI